MLKGRAVYGTHISCPRVFIPRRPVVRTEIKADAKRPLNVACELALAIDAAASHAKPNQAKPSRKTLKLSLGKVAPVSQVQQLVIN